jgi:hypothetical protein
MGFMLPSLSACRADPLDLLFQLPGRPALGLRQPRANATPSGHCPDLALQQGLIEPFDVPTAPGDRPHPRLAARSLADLIRSRYRRRGPGVAVSLLASAGPRVPA